MCIVINMLEWCVFQSYLGIYLLFMKLEYYLDQTLVQTLLGFLTLQPLPYPYPYPSKPLTLGWGQGYEGDRVRVSLSWPWGYPCPSLYVVLVILSVIWWCNGWGRGGERRERWWCEERMFVWMCWQRLDVRVWNDFAQFQGWAYERFTLLHKLNSQFLMELPQKKWRIFRRCST